MSKSSVNHVHRYKKVDLGRNGKVYLVYKCVKPVCSHYIPIHLAEGKMCECNRCGEPMVITKSILTSNSGATPMARPHCPDCTKRKTSDVGTINDFLEGIAVKTD